MSSPVRVRVPASSANLGPGFDTLGLALNLYNYVSIAPSVEDRVDVKGQGAGVLGAGSTNIALLAARLLLVRVGAPAAGLHLTLENEIPLARGLGSSAAARIGALVAANEWAKAQGWNYATNQQILSLATELEGHPDNVAAALLGGLVVSLTESEDSKRAQHKPAAGDVGHAEAGETRALKLPVREFPEFVVFIPDSELATSAARAVLPDVVFRADATFNVAHVAMLVGSLVAGDWDALAEALNDKLHQPYRAPLMPGFEAILHAVREAGGFGATLSGAGPTVLAWLPRDAAIKTEVTQSMRDAAAAHEVFGDVRELSVDQSGCVLDPLAELG